MDPRILYTQMVGLQNPTFKLFEKGWKNGVNNLDPNLTINGTTVTPSFRYKGGDADDTDWDAWDYGDTLSLQAGTAPSYNQSSPLLGDNDDSVKFNNGGYYQASTASSGDITTEDIVVEIIGRFGDATAANQIIIDKRELASGAGYTVSWIDASNTLRFSAEQGDGTDQSIDTDALTAGAWYHIMFFVNRDEGSGHGSEAFVNGIDQNNGVDFSNVAASITSTAKLTIGADDGGSNLSEAHVAYAAMWLQSDWHQAGAAGPTEWASIAKERFQKLIGIYPQKAAGTATPTTATRSSVVYLDKVESGVRKLYWVGDEWLRVVERVDSNGDTIRGYLAEESIENKCLNSEDASSWTKIDAGDTFDSDAEDAPDKATTADGIIADVTDGQHGITQNITVTANTWTFSVFAKKGNKDFLYLANTTIANCTCYFDIDGGTVETSGAGATGYIEDWGDGWYRCCIVFTGTAAAHTFQVSPAHADTDNDFSGDGGTVNIYVWGMQCEKKDYMTSYIPTGAGTVTRNSDELIYKGDDGNLGGVGSEQQGTFVCEVLLPDFSIDRYRNLCELTDGGSSNDRIILYTPSNINVLRTYSKSTEEGAGSGKSGSTDFFNDVIHQVRMTWDNDTYLKSYLDGTEETSETDPSIPNDIDTVGIAMNKGNRNQLEGVISNIKIYKRVYTR